MNIFKYIFCLFFIIVFCSTFNLDAQEATSLKERLLGSTGKDRIKNLHQLSTFYRNISVDSTLFFDYKAINEAKKLKNDSILANAYLRICPIYMFKGYADSAIIYADLAFNIGKHINDLKIISSALQLQANAYYHLGHIDKAIEYNRQSLENYSRIKHLKGMRVLNANLSNIYSEKGDYQKALYHALQTEKLAIQSNSTASKGSAALLLAKIYAYMDQDQKYKTYVQKAKSILKQDSFPRRYATVLSFMAYMYKQEGQTDSAIYYYTENLKIHEELGNLSNIAQAYGNLGAIYQDAKNWDKSYEHLQAALRLKKELNDSIGLTYDYFNLATLFQLQNQADSTLQYCLKSLDMAQRYDVTTIEENALEQLYLFYEKNKQYQKALQYHKLYVAHTNKTKDTTTQKIIATLETKYETEKKDRQIERLKLETIAQASKTNTFRISLITIIGFAGLLIFGILYRRKNERHIFALKQQMYEQKQIEKNKELAYKTKQLTSHALHMIQKNKVLQELKKRILDVAQNVESQDKKALLSLIHRIDFNIQSDKDWDTFRLYFEQTNQNFYDSLNRFNKNLTPNELKLCALIKLNMNIKETASVLNLAPTSVKTARHRLRKKLNLNHGQDLATFIQLIT